MGEITPAQVVYIMTHNQEVELKEVYGKRTVTILGVVQIILGVIAFFLEITGIILIGVPFATGVWTAADVFFILSGSLAIGGAQTHNKCIIVSTLVLNVISSVVAAISIIMTSLVLAVG